MLRAVLALPSLQRPTSPKTSEVGCSRFYRPNGGRAGSRPVPSADAAAGASSGAAGVRRSQSGGWTVAEHQPDGDSGPGGAAGNQPQPSPSGLKRCYLEVYLWLAAVYWLACRRWLCWPPPGSPARSVEPTDDRCDPRHRPGEELHPWVGLDRVSLEVSHGEVLVVMGPSGSGKHLDPHLQRT